jgi:DNA replication protein DnaC
MKTLKQRVAEMKGVIGLDRQAAKSNAHIPKFDYEKNRREYELLANADLQKMQQESKIKRIQQLHGKSELNPKWTFENLQEDAQDVIEAVSIAKAFLAAHKDPKWRKSRAHMMIFYGDYGRGKSHIAGAIAQELINKFETSVLYRQLQTLLDMRLYSYDYQSQDNASYRYREVNQQLLDVDLLILDEVCVNETVLKKNAQSWLGNLLRQRKAANKNCILITNHNLAELEDAIGRYCFESIREYETYQVHFQGPSRRSTLTQQIVSSIQPDVQVQPSPGGPSSPKSSGYQPNQITYKKR